MQNDVLCPAKALLSYKNLPSGPAAGLDQAIHELEQAMLGGAPDPAALAHTRAPTILAFRERVDYRLRLAASPALRTVCDLNFMCGQAAMVALEVNPLLRVLAFGVGGDPNTQRCRKFLEQRYPGGSRDSTLGRMCARQRACCLEKGGVSADLALRCV